MRIAALVAGLAVGQDLSEHKGRTRDLVLSVLALIAVA